jgi:hypothetical protein
MQIASIKPSRCNTNLSSFAFDRYAICTQHLSDHVIMLCLLSKKKKKRKGKRKKKKRASAKMDRSKNSTYGPSGLPSASRSTPRYFPIASASGFHAGRGNSSLLSSIPKELYRGYYDAVTRVKIRTALLNMSLLVAGATPSGILVFALRAGTPLGVNGHSSPRVVSVTSSMCTSIAAGGGMLTPSQIPRGGCTKDKSRC